MVGPTTHTDPDAIPRNGTEVPWVEPPEQRPAHQRDRSAAGDDHGVEDRQRRRGADR
jgi:hypothetical protein